MSETCTCDLLRRTESGESRSLSARLLLAGDRALVVAFSESEQPAVPPGRALEIVVALDRALAAAPPPGFVEAIPAYDSLLVAYDPAVADVEAIARAIERALATLTDAARAPVKRWRIPVVYGGAFGPDLPAVAAHLGLGESEVVSWHAGADYTVAMMGFLPGFTYLAGLPASLAVPRLATPRPRVPGGGIGIGGAQTAIGSIVGPSGWHQIGRTPVLTFDRNRQPVTFLEQGDEVELVAIGAELFADIARAAAAGEIVAERAR